MKPGCPPNKSLPQSGSQSDSGKGTKEDQVRFNKLVKKAKHLAQEGQVQQALELNKEALQIHYHEKLARRIAKMEVSRDVVILWWCAIQLVSYLTK